MDWGKVNQESSENFHSSSESTHVEIKPVFAKLIIIYAPFLQQVHAYGTLVKLRCVSLFSPVVRKPINLIQD